MFTPERLMSKLIARAAHRGLHVFPYGLEIPPDEQLPDQATGQQDHSFAPWALRSATISLWPLFLEL